MVTYPEDIIEYNEIKNIYKRVKGTPITAEKMHKINSATGTIRVFAGGATAIKANVSDLPNANVINVPVVIVQSRGVIDFIYCNDPCTFKNEMWGYTSSDAYAVKFLFYYLKHNVDYFRNAGDGRSSFSQISLPITEEYRIPVIPIEEKQAITSILSDFDEHIDNLTELIKKKKAIRDGALEDLLSGRTRINGFVGDWEEVTLGTVTTIFNGDRGANYPAESEFISYGVPFVNAGHLNNGKVLFNGMDYISKEHYSLLGGGKIIKNDILFCLRGSLGKFALVDFDEGAPASSLCIVRSKETINPLFLAQLMSSSIIKNSIEAANTGSSQPNLSAKDISNFEFKIPVDIKEQQAIAQVLTSINEEIDSLEIERAKMIQIKEGAMDDLLTGRVRLKV